MRGGKSTAGRGSRMCRSLVGRRLCGGLVGTEGLVAWIQKAWGLGGELERRQGHICRASTALL